MANPEFRLSRIQYLQSILKDTDCYFSSGEIWTKYIFEQKFMAQFSIYRLLTRDHKL